MNELTALASGVARAGRWAFDIVAMGFGVSTPALTAGQLIDVGAQAANEAAQSLAFNAGRAAADDHWTDEVHVWSWNATPTFELPTWRSDD